MIIGKVEVEIFKLKDMDLRGATVVDGFPSVGLVSSIVANYLIAALRLDQISGLDSPDFPPVSLVYASKPKCPARIYADEKIKLTVVLSEFTPPPKLARPIGNAIFNWAREKGCWRIISPEGIPSTGARGEQEWKVYGVGSNDRAREELRKAGIAQLEQGIITGVSGILLNEGRKNDFDVICLLVESRPEIPDAGAAAKIIECITSLIPQIKIDVEPLYRDAEEVEKYLKMMREQAKPSEPEVTSTMYG